MQTTKVLGLKKPETNEFYNVNDFNNNADTVDALFEKDSNGNALAKNAKMLDGHEAEYFQAVESETLTTSILEKALTLSQGTYEYSLGGGSYTGTDLPSSNYKYGKATVRTKGASSTITVILWGVLASGNVIPPVFNLYNGGNWSGWQTLATVADLAKYLPLTGGTVNGNLGVVKSDTSEVMMRVKNSVAEVRLLSQANGKHGLYSTTHGKYIASCDADGTNTFNGTASGNLPLDGGGEVKSTAVSPIRVNNTGGNAKTLFGFLNNGALQGYLGFKGVEKPFYQNTTGGEYDLLHTGNMSSHVLPLTGGTTSGDVEVSKTSGDSSRVKVSTAQSCIGLVASSDGSSGVMDYLDGKYLLVKYANGKTDFNGTATGNLPLDGAMAKNLTIKEGTSQSLLRFALADGTSLGGVGFAPDGTLYTWNGAFNKVYSLLHTGNMASHVLPLDGGGTVKRGDVNPLVINSTSTEADEIVRIPFQKSGVTKGYLGFVGTKPMFTMPNYTRYELHHDGNSAKVVISNTAPSDTSALWIDTSA